jgi:hypothetical protein
MKQTLMRHKLALTRDTVRNLTKADPSNAADFPLCTRCDTTCHTCRCTGSAL